MIPEIDIWRVAKLMLKRYGDQAQAESAIRMQELALNGDSAGAAAGYRCNRAVGEHDTTRTDALTGPPPRQCLNRRCAEPKL